MHATPMTLRYPVFLPGGEELLPAGTPLSRGLLEKLSARRGGKRGPERSLIRHGTVRRDLREMTRQGTYRTIFRDREECSALFRRMEQDRLPLPVLESLDYFHQKDPYTYKHTLMVFALSCLLARRLGGEFRAGIEGNRAGPLHDVGKLCVPLDILRKSSPLRRTDRDVLEHHTLAGHVLLFHYLGDAGELPANVARDHHERKDASGYPRGIRLRNRLAEVIAACDVYDALVSPRPYRKESFDNRTALEEITAMAEQGKIGWGIVQALVARNRKDHPLPRLCKVSSEKRGTPPEGNFYGIIVEDPPAPPNPA